MNRICSIHNKTIIEVCLDTECSNRNLCHICIREHPINHDSKVRDVLNLAEDETWLKSLEEKKDQLINEGKALLQQKEVMFELRNDLKKAFENLREELTNRENSIMKELDAILGNDEKIAESNSFLFETEKHLSSIQEIDFRVQDYYKRVERGLDFEESRTVRTKKLINEAQKAMKQSLLEKNKISYFQDELTLVIQSLDASNFLFEKPMRSAILNQEVRSKIEDLDNYPLKKSLKENLKAEQPKENQNIQMMNKGILLNIEQSLDHHHDHCGPKLRFSGNLEVYYCKGSIRGCDNSNKIWGSNPYTCDTHKCTSLRHYGICPRFGGYALLEYIQGKDSYEGTRRNGISSKSWKAFPRSYNVLGEVTLQTVSHLKNIEL